MRIRKYIHSCLLIEKGSERILFDPGKFSFIEGRVQPREFQGIAAILITHFHPDHLDEQALRTILGNNPSAKVLANSHIHSKLADLSIPVDIFEGGRRKIGGFVIEAIDAPHAAILGAEPPPNTSYLVDDVFLMPGDSFHDNLNAKAGTQVLALPTTAPWMKELDAAEFADRMQPKDVVPIHDGYLRNFFLQMRYENYDRYFSARGIRFHSMHNPGDTYGFDRYSAES